MIILRRQKKTRNEKKVNKFFSQKEANGNREVVENWLNLITKR